MKTFNSSRVKKNSTSPKVVVGLMLLCVLAFIALNIRSVVKSISPHGLGLSEEMVQYKSPSGQYSILVSTKWIILDFPPENHKNTDIKTTINSPFASLDIYVSSKYFDSNLLDDVANWRKVKTESKYMMYKEIGTSEYSNEKREGVLTEYFRNIYSPFIGFFWNSKEMHCIDYYFLVKKYGYNFSFCSVEKVWGDAEELFMIMIDSIEF